MGSAGELFRLDHLAIFVGACIVAFLLLTVIYSLEHMRGRNGLARYYVYLVLTCLISILVVLADNLLLFIVSWGLLGPLLYLLIGFGTTEHTSQAAKKAFIIVGGTDVLMLLGLALLWQHAGGPSAFDFRMSGAAMPLGGAGSVAFLCLAAGAFAKAGAIPFDTWVPDTAANVPAPVAAYLLASLDKLVGIYFLFRLCQGIFEMTQAMNTLLMALGGATIVVAGMAALVQHDLKRLLGYHAVSQVGYMVIGIGTGNPLGIAGALFHMLNHTIYKSCLFFTAGAVEKKAGTVELERLGGLAKAMPVTFGAFFISALSIAGVPPLNGFASKWMIYQGIIETGKAGESLWILWLLAASFGNTLTLASFMKLTHAVFLSPPSSKTAASEDSSCEVSPAMWFPPLVLAALCIVFGVFAYAVPLKFFILPSVEQPVEFLGLWQAGITSVVIIASLGAGVLVYALSTAGKARRVQPFIGGEDLDYYRDMRISGVDFYKTIEEIPVLNRFYGVADRKYFDVYETGARFVFGVSGRLRALHNGILTHYLVWCVLGMIVLLYALRGGRL